MHCSLGISMHSHMFVVHRAFFLLVYMNYLYFALQCPIDTRKQLAENIVLIGGTVMTPGFK